MNRDDMHFRDRLLLLAECSNPHRPFNVKRKPLLSKQGSSKGSPKLSVQDFVRMDPGYTPDIEHLVFPAKKRSPQQVAPTSTAPTGQQMASKSRSRLVEMFALSRHLHQKSVERETKSRAGLFNRSVDSAVPYQPRQQKVSPSSGGGPPRSGPAARRWMSETKKESEGKRQTVSSDADGEKANDPARMTSTRGPNVSILHLRSTSEPWESAPSTTYPISGRGAVRCRPAHGPAPRLTKHQSLGSAPPPPPPLLLRGRGQRTTQAPPGRWEVEPPDMFVDRDLSPVRWHDREVDGVYLGRSGWVQVQHRSLDEKRRSSYIGNKLANFRSTPSRDVMKNYRFNSEPERPAYLSLRGEDLDREKEEEEEIEEAVNFEEILRSSPPPATPIISPPPAFQDEKNKKTTTGRETSTSGFFAEEKSTLPTTRPFFRDGEGKLSGRRFLRVDEKSTLPTGRRFFGDEEGRREVFAPGEKSTLPTARRNFFGKPPFLPRSNAIEDSDASSPPITPRWPRTGVVRSSEISPNLASLPQTKSLEDTTAARRYRFLQHYRGSSSSSSSSMTFRSLESGFNRPPPGVAMPRLSENTDSSSIDYRHQDADDEDNYSSSINVRITAPAQKVSPSTRSNRQMPHHPPPDDSSSSSSSSNETSPRRYQEEATQRVRRSRSLQLPEKKVIVAPQKVSPQRISPQQQGGRIDTIPERPRRVRGKPQSEEGMIREAEIVTGYLYGSRSRAAAQALLNHRLLNGGQSSKEEVSCPAPGPAPSNSDIAVYYVGGAGEANKRPVRRQGQPRGRRERKGGAANGGGGSSGSSRGGGGSTPDSRPGSAPTAGRGESLQAQQRSMSLPKSFLSTAYQPCGTILWQRHGTEGVGSSPGPPRKTPSPETSHTAPVTPLHESSRRRSPINVPPPARPKASSTPQLLDERRKETSNWPDEFDHHLEVVSVASVEKGPESHGNPSVSTTAVRIDKEMGGSETVLQKFKKSLSLRFQAAPGKKGGKEGFCPEAECPAPPVDGNSEEEPANQGEECRQETQQATNQEQKHKFGSLIWRSSKEKKKLSKSIRNAKCNSGDSGIQIEMAPGCGGGFGDSSESHDTDPLCDEPLDGPPLVGRGEGRGRDDDEGAGRSQAARPQPQPVGQVPADELKADLDHYPRHFRRVPAHLRAGHARRRPSDQSVRRTRSDLGAAAERRPAHCRRRRPATEEATPTEMSMRRSLSQPVGIDEIGLEAERRVGSSAAPAPAPPPLLLPSTSSSSDECRTTSNSESSLASLPDRPACPAPFSPSLRPRPAAPFSPSPLLLAEAVFDHVSIDGEELAFRAGDLVRVLDSARGDWWWGRGEGKRGGAGWFPSNSVRVRAVEKEEVEEEAGPSDEKARTGVVRELIQTESDFVSCLTDVVVGYLGECRRRSDMFVEAEVRRVFANIEQILEFQKGFLRDLRERIDPEAPHKSRIGGCFLRHRDGFRIYSEYCNSYPGSTAALQEMYGREGYREFFEACRLMRGLTEIPLDGYLLTPVQRICKYPLQLAELLKYTGKDHPDYLEVKEALEAMRGVAVLINERKRRMECLEKLARWQDGLEGWEGEDLIESSSQLIHQGEVVKVTTGMWANNITLFLFDHQILYCKKDILKRNSYVYKGRISLDNCEVIDLPDGKDLLLGVSIRHAIKLLDRQTDDFLLFCCRSEKNKLRWLRAFSEERRVSERADPELDFPPAARQLAKIAAKCNRRPPRKFKEPKPSIKPEYATDSLGRRVGKVGNWFGFKKSARHHRHLHEAP